MPPACLLWRIPAADAQTRGPEGSACPGRAREAYDMEAVYVHDPTAFAAVTHPEHFTWRTCPVRVLTEGVARGMTVMDAGLKRWNSPNGWTGRPKVQVAVDVQAEQVVAMLLQRMRA